MSDERLARKLSRSIEAVRARRHEKRISIRRKWLPQEEKLLGTRPDSAVARLLGWAISSVFLRRRQLRIPPFREQGDIEKKLATMSNERIGRLLRQSHRLRPVIRFASGKGAPCKWSPREDELLGKWPDERLARFLGRTTKAVEGRRHKLGILYAKPGRRWKPEEVKLLDPALIRGSVKEWTARLARELGRTYVSVAHQRRLTYGPRMDCRPWTKRELRMLGTRPDPEVAAAIGRKAGTVQVKRGHLGIPSFRERSKIRWKPARDKLLGTRSDPALARLWRVPVWSIKKRRQELGISSSVYRNWTPEEERLVGTMSDEEVARRIGRTGKAVIHRRLNQLGIARTRLRRWTREEERLVGTMSDREVARRIRRTAKAVQYKRLTLRMG